jgi:hypothetical protein
MRTRSPTTDGRSSNHLLPEFAHHRLSQIRVQDVDRYMSSKHRKLAPASINRTLTLLSTILELAVEYELLSRNPAKRRREAPAKRRPVFFDTAEHIMVLLDAAAELDADKLARTSGAGRSSRRSCSRVCGSARRATCAGVT